MADTTSEVVYQFVCRFIQERGYPPSLQEIARGCYISVSYAARCLNALQEQGRLVRERGKARSIQLTSPSPTFHPPCPPL